MIEKKFKVLLFYPNNPLLGFPPINLAILSACLKKVGFDTKLFDCTIYKNNNETNDDVRAKLGHVKPSKIDSFFPGETVNMYDDFVKTVEEYKPDIIGATVIDSTITFSFEFMKLIKHKNIPVVFGGVGAVFGYEKILNSGLVDYVCIGEGEETIVELCENLQNKKDCSEIQNIYFKNDSGEIIKNTLRQLVNLNELPNPDFSIYKYYRFYRPFFGDVIRMLPVDTDRGCPFKCTYCASPALKDFANKNNIGKWYRTKSFDKIFNEINQAVKLFDINYLSFISDTFSGLPIKKFREFSTRYKKEVNLPFSCQTRLDTLTEEKTKLLFEMGCKTVAVGLEHGSEKIRKELLDKRLTNIQIINGFTELSKYDIVPGINVMLGLPDETRENVFETIELTKQITKILKGKHTINVFSFIPFHGTKLRQVSIDKGYITGNEDIPISYFGRSLLNMPSMSKDEMQGLEKTFTLYVRLPESYYDDIKIAEQDNEEGQKMFDKLNKIFEYEKICL